MDVPFASEKIKTLAELKIIAGDLKAEGRTLVWTNGCFDILHAGHVLYLEKAALEGDVLMVGVNSDESVRKVKGAGRPVVAQDERALVIAALESVNFVLVFNDADTTGLLEALRPQVYAKGGDYTVDTVNQDERRIVEKYGGRAVVLPGIEGKSTTALLDRIARPVGPESD